ncbi:HAMP domain-containing sensor histidine kinase [Robbsia sp. Bb-Pol-6]|uniref:histidine kinase n=1 Tax=Robbsia betulipollinis TaxID=2981849 RepID=A0ABT3ZGZ1_9BURK|nr:HAMP domain-containing sensor histidine kinase [Robbsia betulipollinis]MCY0385793.1 HAMP domain-containing sensor histidine kinase [Robbsia betulipollinis]
MSMKPSSTLALTLTQRLSLVFAALLLACCGASAWLRIHSNDLHEKEVIQSLSRGLASHIAGNRTLMDASGPRTDALKALFGQLMVVNPSVEVYLLDSEGTIRGDDAPAGHLKRERVDLAPIKRFLGGAPLPVFGDDPRSAAGRKVFSAAPVAGTADRPGGYIYVVLQSELRDRLDAEVQANAVLKTTLRLMALVAVLGLLAGLTAFWLITRPLRRLTQAMRHFDANGEPDKQPRVPRTASTNQRDDIVVLDEPAKLEYGLVSLDPEVFSLEDLLQDVLEKFELSVAAKRIALHVERPPALPAIRADLGMIERILTNLLDNAIRHTPEEGVVTVLLSHHDQRVWVTCRDTGPGIPAAMRDSLFVRPFHSGRVAQSGGLGLLLVHRMLQLHGGHITLVDETATGTTFRFDLPAARTD